MDRDPADARACDVCLGQRALSRPSRFRRRAREDIYVVGKQWMWKIQHPNGRREINELHVPVGRAGEADARFAGRDPQLFTFPRFASSRTRFPASYRTMWFQADASRRVSPLLRRILRHRSLGHDRPGRGDGADRVSEAGSAGVTEETPVAGGREAVRQFDCVNCHERRSGSAVRRWADLYGTDSRSSTDGGNVVVRRSVHSRIDPRSQGQNRARASSR